MGATKQHDVVINTSGYGKYAPYAFLVLLAVTGFCLLYFCVYKEGKEEPEEIQELIADVESDSDECSARLPRHWREMIRLRNSSSAIDINSSAPISPARRNSLEHEDDWIIVL